MPGSVARLRDVTVIPTGFSFAVIVRRADLVEIEQRHPAPQGSVACKGIGPFGDGLQHLVEVASQVKSGRETFLLERHPAFGRFGKIGLA